LIEVSERERQGAVRQTKKAREEGGEVRPRELRKEVEQGRGDHVQTGQGD